MNNILEYLQKHATDQPNDIAFRLLEGASHNAITYSELQQQSIQLAKNLAGLYAPGARILLIYTSNFEFIIAFLACLLAGMVPVPTYPPNPNRHRLGPDLMNLQRICDNAEPSLILTEKRIKALLKVEQARSALQNTLQYFKGKNTTSIDLLTLPMQTIKQHSAPSQQSLPQLQNLAFLQYTSGSTGHPKGVMISHQNIIDNTSKIARVFNEINNIVTWLPLYHDMGLMNAIFLPLLLKIPGNIISPMEFLVNPASWLQAISAYPHCSSGGPNFAYEHCIQKIKPEAVKHLKLDTWKLAYTGAESIHHETLERFTKKFASAGFKHQAFYPCYGLAESTVGVTGRGVKSQALSHHHFDKLKLQQHKIETSSDQTNSHCIVGCGSWPEEDQLLIVDPNNSAICADNSIGEIWIQGNSIAMGYWNNPTATQNNFQAYTSCGKEPFLRTGDLGFIFNDELYITGRIKDLIILHGKNYAAEDIEWVLQQAHPSIRKGCTCAFSCEIEQQEQLVLAAEIKADSSNITDILQCIRESVSSAFGTRIHTIALLDERSLLKTSSGKIRRFANKEAYIQYKLPIIVSQSHDLNLHYTRDKKRLKKFNINPTGSST